MASGINNQSVLSGFEHNSIAFGADFDGRPSVAASAFGEAVCGYVFRLGERGLGYYVDHPITSVGDYRMTHDIFGQAHGEYTAVSSSQQGISSMQGGAHFVWPDYVIKNDSSGISSGHGNRWIVPLWDLLFEAADVVAEMHHTSNRRAKRRRPKRVKNTNE